jgi:hypothetical protein
LNWFINQFTPNAFGTAAFEEDGYGTVAVQGEGEYGQKTFLFSYALAHLADGSQGTKEELMSRIMEFFNLFVKVNENHTDNELNIFPNPSRGVLNITYDFNNHSNIILTMHNIEGKELLKIHLGSSKTGSYVLNGSDFSPGLYFIKLKTDNGFLTKKIIIE